jgi:hypothetical protein
MFLFNKRRIVLQVFPDRCVVSYFKKDCLQKISCQLEEINQCIPLRGFRRKSLIVLLAPPCIQIVTVEDPGVPHSLLAGYVAYNGALHFLSTDSIKCLGYRKEKSDLILYAISLREYQEIQQILSSNKVVVKWTPMLCAIAEAVKCALQHKKEKKELTVLFADESIGAYCFSYDTEIRWKCLASPNEKFLVEHWIKEKSPDYLAGEYFESSSLKIPNLAMPDVGSGSSSCWPVIGAFLARQSLFHSLDLKQNNRVMLTTVVLVSFLFFVASIFFFIDNFQLNQEKVRFKKQSYLLKNLQNQFSLRQKNKEVRFQLKKIRCLLISLGKHKTPSFVLHHLFFKEINKQLDLRFYGERVSPLKEQWKKIAEECAISMASGFSRIGSTPNFYRQKASL